MRKPSRPAPTPPPARTRSEDGATATEYGILVSFIAIALLIGVGLFGTAVNDMFDSFGTWVTTNL